MATDNVATMTQNVSIEIHVLELQEQCQFKNTYESIKHITTESFFFFGHENADSINCGLFQTSFRPRRYFFSEQLCHTERGCHLSHQK